MSLTVQFSVQTLQCQHDLVLSDTPLLFFGCLKLHLAQFQQIALEVSLLSTPFPLQSGPTAALMARFSLRAFVLLLLIALLSVFTSEASASRRGSSALVSGRQQVTHAQGRRLGAVARRRRKHKRRHGRV